MDAPPKKKVLIVTDTYYPKIDGVMRFLSETIPRIQSDFDLSLLVPDFKHPEEYFSNIPKTKLKVSRIISLSGYAPIRMSLSNMKKIRTAVKEADTIFIQGPAHASIIALYYGHKYKKRVIFFTHHILWELYEKFVPLWMRPIVKPILKRLTIGWYNKCNLLVVPYKDFAQELTNIGVKTEITIARLGVDTNSFVPIEHKSDAKLKINIDPYATVIGYVGRISNEKNLTVLIEAFQRVHAKYKCSLLIVGSGTKDMINQFKHMPGIMMAGFQAHVIPYFQAMDIFVMPSLTETTSLATLEAMACGVPVITTRVGFIKQYVRKDYNGLLFPKGNTATLVLQLEKLLSSPDKRKVLSNNARGTAMIFSWDATAERLREILNQ